MRCIACDKNLSDFESTRKHHESGEYIDMCNKCYSTIQQDVTDVDERHDLRHVDDDNYDYDEQ
jgi:NAD-dependent SIR2 family protein deacetylase